MQYDFNLVANAGMSIDVKGRFFKYKNGAGLIRVRTSKGGFVDLLPGQGVWNTDFTSLTISDRSGLPNAGVILAGDFDFHDDRITGDVSVIDNAKARTIANTAFALTIYTGPVAGQRPTTQLWNPAGSGKKVTISRAYVSSNTAGVLRIGTADSIIGAVIPDIAAPKLTGGNVGSSQASSANMAGNPTNYKFLSWTYVTANETFTFDCTEPVILMPGYGFYVQNPTAGTDVTMTLQYTEEAL